MELKPYETKSFFEHDIDDWITWIQSYRDLPLKENNDHIGDIIDVYVPYEVKRILIKIIKE